MQDSRTFYVSNFGCRATQADGAGIETELLSRGLSQGNTALASDVVVINTCTVTDQADQDARKIIRRIHRENPQAEILVTGCYAQRQPTEVAAMEGVKWVVGNSHKSTVGEVVAPQLISIREDTNPQHSSYHGEIHTGGILVSEDFEKVSELSTRVIAASFDRSRPNLKIQDGCNNRCRFCIIPSVRGGSRSASMNSVLSSIRQLSKRYPEVVLTGINLGRWGRDLDGRPRLISLLRCILAETPIQKIRLSSVEPMDWTNELLSLMASTHRIAKHVHIPMQSGSDEILKSMGRRYRKRHYLDRVTRARRLMSMAAIGADVMVGFPGETDKDFEETKQLISDLPFTYLHVFSYSRRPGTEACRMQDEVNSEKKKERSHILRELSRKKNLGFRRSLIGKTFSAVTLNQADGANVLAMTDNYVPVQLKSAGEKGIRPINVEVLSATAECTRALELDAVNRVK